MNTEEIILKVKDITEDYNSILSIEKAIELGLHGGPHNGSGPRTKLSKIFINITFYGNNANPNIYPKCYSFEIYQILKLYKFRPERPIPLAGLKYSKLECLSTLEYIDCGKLSFCH